MRLIIKEYIAKLKEKDELDLLLCDLLLAMGYITDNVPKTGNRQYGVDIQAHKANEILLCVIKQGNLDRDNWDGNSNAIRSSLNEIRDSYLRILTDKEKKKRLKIAVVLNGVLDEAARSGWEGYVDENTNWKGCPIEIELWNIDRLVDEIQKLLLNEYLFDNDMQSLLRKALYFVEETDYKNIFFENIIDKYIENLEKQSNSKQFKKEMASLNLATQMIAQYAADAKIFKISVMVSEYLIISYWKFLLKNSLLGKKQYIEWVITFCKNYEKWNRMYFLEVKECCNQKDMFPVYNTVENKVMIYEVLGHLCTYAYYLEMTQSHYAERVIASIVALINNNPAFYYPAYDSHINVINMVLRLFNRKKMTENMKTVLEQLVIRLRDYYVNVHKYPTATDSFLDAVNIEMGNETEAYETSGLWGYVLIWIALLEQKDLYEEVFDFLSEDLKQVTKCAWFLRDNEEELFYNPYAMNLAGEGISIEPEEYDVFEKKVKFILSQYDKEIFSYEKFSFSALEMITCRYYNYVPRCKVGVEDN